LYSVKTFSQDFSVEEQNQIDSLTNIINDASNSDTLLASAYINLSQILYIVNIDTLASLSEKAKKITENGLLNNPPKNIEKTLLKYQAIALSNIGYVHKTHGNTIKTLEYWNNSLKIQKEINDIEGLSSTLNNLGYIYKSQGDIEKALEFYHESLKLCQQRDDQAGEALSFNNIGLIYYNQGDIEKALEYCQHSLKIRKEIDHKSGVAQTLNNIGVIYDNQGHKDSALIYFHESLNIRQEIGNKKDIAASLQHIGKALCELDSIDKGLSLLKQGIQISQSIDNKLWIAYTADVISSQYLRINQIDSAEYYANLSMEIANKIGYPSNIERAAHNLFEVHLKRNEFEKALEMYMLKIKMRDSINNDQTQKATIRQQTKYEYEKQKAIDDAEHEKLITIKQEEKEKQQIITYAISFGLLLVVLFLFFVANRLQITKKQKVVIEKQKKDVEMAHQKLEEKAQEILDSISYAKRIQSAILPPLKTVKEQLKNSFILYKPKDVVAGDFYWMESIPGQANNKSKVLFAAADCTGHGVPGAMVSVVCNNALNRSVREQGLVTPGKILDNARKIVVEEFEKSDQEVKDGMDIALCSLQQLDTRYQLEYAGANNPLWIIRNGEIIETKANKQPIGKFENPLPYTTHTFELIKGDNIYIFSDGYTDQFGGEKGKKIKANGLRKLLLSIQNKSMDEQKEILDHYFEEWKGNLEQIDDVCIIGVRI